MTESRYKIEHVLAKPETKKKFRFFGAFGYLWFAMMASVLTYGIVYKYITTDEILSYYQKFKTAIVNTEVADLAFTKQEPKKQTPLENNSSAKAMIVSTLSNGKKSDDNLSIENTENAVNTNNTNHQLVSEVVNDNDLPEDVVFESESIELPKPLSAKPLEQASSESLASNTETQQNNVNLKEENEVRIGQTETIEDATLAIQNEIKKAENTDDQKPVVQAETIEVTSLIEKTPTAAEEIVIPKDSSPSSEEPKEKVDNPLASLEETATDNAKTIKDATVEASTEVVQINPLTALSALVQNSIATASSKDAAYIKAMMDYETNKIASADLLEKIKTQEKEPSKKTSDSLAKESGTGNTSAVDAIIAAMNADKAAKEKSELSSQEKLQSEINSLLLK